jgi:tRNA-guanine family transglycosylase
MEAFFYTNRGLHPHLVNALPGVQLCLSHIYPLRTILPQTTLRDYFSLPSSLLYLSLRDILDPHSLVFGKDSCITIRSPESSTLTVTDYMSFVNAHNFDLVPSFAEEADCASGNHKSARSATQAIEAVDKCLELKAGAYRLLGNIQGGRSLADRTTCAELMIAKAVDGFILGSFGANDSAWDIIEAVGEVLQGDSRVKMLSGLGRPIDILHGAAFGFDLFEVTYPFVAAKEGLALVSEYSSKSEFNLQKGSLGETLDLNQAQFKRDARPLVEGCPCEACKSHTRAYIHHLLTCSEMTANLLLTVHNVAVTQGLIAGLRQVRESGEATKLKELLALARPEP